MVLARKYVLIILYILYYIILYYIILYYIILYRTLNICISIKYNNRSMGLIT